MTFFKLLYLIVLMPFALVGFVSFIVKMGVGFGYAGGDTFFDWLEKK